MEKKNVICPHCDSDLIQSHYNYDTGKLNYHCEECNSRLR
jgi:transposase-like protein